MLLLRATLFGLLTVLTLHLSSGCAHYRWGHGATLPFERIYVQPADNASFAPQAQALISTQVREALLRDGRVKLVGSETAADAVLQIQLKDYLRTANARSSTDTEVARNFNLQLVAEIDLYNRHTNRYLIQNRSIYESTQAYTGNPYQDTNMDGYARAEYQAMPRLTRGLARKISDAILSAW